MLVDFTHCDTAAAVRQACAVAIARRRVFLTPAPAPATPAAPPAPPPPPKPKPAFFFTPLGMDTPPTAPLPNRRKRTSDIINAACALWGISREDLIGHGRTGRLILPRHAAMVVVKQKTGLSLPQIGKAFGGRDHSSILFVTKEKFWADRRLQEAVEMLTAAIEAEGGARGWARLPTGH